MPPKHRLAAREQNAERANGASSASKRKADTSSTDVAARTHKSQRGTTSQPYLHVRNTAPTQKLDVYVFGTNCDGELGLGDATTKTEIPRPVLSPKLPADTGGIVHLAVGGVHSAALTHDNSILTWGVNDEGALGRDTTQRPEEIKLRDLDDDSDSDVSDVKARLNMNEATPLPVNTCSILSGTVFTQLAATDSATFALTTEGFVYGWGTFRGSSGKMGFFPGTEFVPDAEKQQGTPVVLQGLKNVTKLSAGAQHMLALTAEGIVFSWGCNEQYQLGRRRAYHSASHPLLPRECALPSGVTDIGAGQYHSFAIHKTGAIYAWGSNNYGQTAVFTNAGNSDAAVIYPTRLHTLPQTPKVISIQGGKDHSLAITEDGCCLSWGRVDNKALGLDVNQIPSRNLIFDAYDRPRILKIPTVLIGLDQAVTSLGIGTDHSLAITQDGHAYGWGFNAQKQVGQPGDVDEVLLPTLLSSKHVDGKKLVLAAAGGQFSLVAGQHTG